MAGGGMVGESPSYMIGRRDWDENLKLALLICFGFAIIAFMFLTFLAAIVLFVKLVWIVF